MTIFEKIAAGEIPSHKVHEDDQVMVIMDIDPVRPGHCLVIPKVAYPNIQDLPDDLYAHLFAIAKRVAKKIDAAYNPVKVAMAVHGFDTPDHCHLHIFPSFESSDLKTDSDVKHTGEPDHESLAQEAEKLKL